MAPMASYRYVSPLRPGQRPQPPPSSASRLRTPGVSLRFGDRGGRLRPSTLSADSGAHGVVQSERKPEQYARPRVRAPVLRLGLRVLVDGGLEGTIRFTGEVEYAKGAAPRACPPRTPAPGSGQTIRCEQCVVSVASCSSRRCAQLRAVSSPNAARRRCAGDFVGVELDDPLGKNNGTVKGVRYFSCKPKHGLFVRPYDVEVRARQTLMQLNAISRVAVLLQVIDVYGKRRGSASSSGSGTSVGEGLSSKHDDSTERDDSLVRSPAGAERPRIKHDDSPVHSPTGGAGRRQAPKDAVATPRAVSHTRRFGESPAQHVGAATDEAKQTARPNLSTRVPLRTDEPAQQPSSTTFLTQDEAPEEEESYVQPAEPELRRDERPPTQEEEESYVQPAEPEPRRDERPAKSSDQAVVSDDVSDDSGYVALPGDYADTDAIHANVLAEGGASELSSDSDDGEQGFKPQFGRQAEEPSEPGANDADDGVAQRSELLGGGEGDDEDAMGGAMRRRRDHGDVGRKAMSREAQRAEGKQEEPEALTADGQCLKSVLSEGSGEVARPGDIVVVHYVGQLLDGRGTTIDNSRWHEEPFEFRLGEGDVIAGWDVCVATMRAGETARLLVGPEYAYGEEGVPPQIPPNASLSFDIDLLRIERATLGRRCFSFAMEWLPILLVLLLVVLAAYALYADLSRPSSVLLDKLRRVTREDDFDDHGDEM